jgi:hypothetical protein
MTSTPGLKNLVLLGLGHAHVQVLRGLAHSRPADLNLTVIAPRPLAVYSGMVPGFVAGHYTAEQCRIPLDALLARSGARTIAGSAIGIDAETRTVALASGEAVPWDWLSVNTGPIMDRDLLEVRMPGARRHALFVRPIDAFVQLWPQVAEMAASRPIHLAVVGAGAAGVELAMAASHALQGSGMPQGSHVSLVTGGEPPAAIYPQAVQARVQRALRRFEPRLTSLSHGGGCGCKIAPGVLSEILKGTAQCAPLMPMPPELLVGIETADDAAVYQLNDEQALIATTDFFMPIVDDPFDFGRIAATNAISDVYAMGGTPIMALALVGMPINVLSTKPPSADPGRRRLGVPRGGHPDCGRPHHRFGRAHLRPGGAGPGAPRSASSATPTRRRATCWCWASRWAWA